MEMKAVVELLPDMVDVRDPYTVNHSSRVSTTARMLSEQMGLAEDEVCLVERAARVHDIGKVMVDISILSKEGRLADHE